MAKLNATISSAASLTKILIDEQSEFPRGGLRLVQEELHEALLLTQNILKEESYESS